LTQIARIIGAYIFAVCIAALIGTIYHRIAVGDFAFIFLFADREYWEMAQAEASPFNFFLQTSILFGLLYGLPSLVFVLIAELKAYRSSVFYALSGILVGNLFSFFPPQNITLSTITGLASGLIYWLVAGRSAGSWRKSKAIA
jgi:uncharacterized membrane protein